MRQIVFEETTDGITIDRVIRDYEYTMPTKHLHDEYEIYYLLEGTRLYFIGQNTYLIGKGSMVFINKNVIHKTGLASGPYHDRILIEFSEEPFAGFYSFLGELSLSEFFEKHQGIMEFDERERVDRLQTGCDEQAGLAPHLCAEARRKRPDRSRPDPQKPQAQESRRRGEIYR